MGLIKSLARERLRNGHRFLRRLGVRLKGHLLKRATEHDVVTLVSYFNHDNLSYFQRLMNHKPAK